MSPTYISTRTCLTLVLSIVVVIILILLLLIVIVIIAIIIIVIVIVVVVIVIVITKELLRRSVGRRVVLYTSVSCLIDADFTIYQFASKTRWSHFVNIQKAWMPVRESCWNINVCSKYVVLLIMQDFVINIAQSIWRHRHLFRCFTMHIDLTILKWLYVVPT